MPKTRKLKGRSVSARDLKLIHQSAYKKVRDKQVGDWILDEPISKATASVYFNPNINQAIVVHRGTEGTLSDWSNNAAYVMGTNKSTKRYKDSEAVQKAAEAKYSDVITTGHSQGGIYTKLAKDQKKVININPASMGEISEGTTIRSKLDPVSMLAAPSLFVKGLFNPSSKDKHITTSAKFNPLDAHSLNILDELGDKQLGGQLETKRAVNETNDRELDRLMVYYNIKKYNGCFVKDELPVKLKNGFYIINLNGKSHWTALLKHGKKYYYFDSFGFPSPIEVEERIPKEYIWSDKHIQTEPTSSCGFYVVAWIKYMNEHKDKKAAFKDFINSFEVDSTRNEYILKKYFLE